MPICLLYAVLSLSAALELTDPIGQVRYLQPRSTWKDLRLHVAFNSTSVGESLLTHLKTGTLPTVTRWFQKVLRVPTLASPLKLTEKYCGQAVVPDSHMSDGVAADAIIYIVVVPTKIAASDSSAYGSPCLISSAVPQRVLAGTVWLTLDYWQALSSSTQVHTLAHLFAHVLAFNSVLFPHFNKPDGSLYSEVVRQDTESGNTVYVMTLPTVLARAKLAFDCPTLSGVRLAEKSDPDGFTFSHWSAKMMLNDFMSDLVLGDVVFSDISLGVFQDSGWYEVQWEFTDSVQFGRKRGCAFFLSPCIAAKQSSFAEFCVGGKDLCAPTATARGDCTLLTYQYGVPAAFRYLDLFSGGPQQLDYCPVVSSSISCLEGTADGPGEEKCANCRCLTGAYYPVAGPKSTRTSHCHRVSCRGGLASVVVGSATVVCPREGGAVQVAGYSGTLQCPPAAVLCSKAPCKDLCSGFGRCEDGRCVCDLGYTDDCSQTCPAACLHCTSSDQCTECRAGAVLESGRCNCSPGLRLTADGFCSLSSGCPAVCRACVSSTECTSCYAPTMLSAAKCVCPAGKVLDSSGTCANCAAQCKICSFPDVSVCLECFDTAVLSSQAPYCQCSSGYFDFASLQCLSCAPLCASCSAAGCDACVSGFELSSGDCVCPRRSSNYIETSQCSPCHPQCQSCSGPTAVDCLSCAADAFLTSTPGRCLCRTPTAEDCVPCMITKDCAACTPPSSFVCTACYPNARLISNSCVCSDGFFPNPDASLCSPCHPSCRTCFAAHYLACYSCPSFALQSGTQCVCTSSYFVDTDKCKPCADSHCLLCDKERCYHCLYGFDFDKDQRCLLQSGFYFDEGTHTTYVCPTNCATCKLATAPVCTSCEYASMVITSNQCACPSATFLDTAADQCKSCGHSKCLACTSAASCSQCAAPFLVSSSAICACPQGTFETSGDCKACHSSCTSCTGSLESQCTVCPSYAFLLSGYCLCLQTTSSTSCKKCGPGCLTCSPANLSQCLSCPSGADLSNGQCFCKSGFYSSSSLVCSSCSVACATCKGPLPTDCLKCAGSTQQAAGACPCPSGYGLSSSTCAPCSYSCLLCAPDDSAKCTQCTTNALLQSGKCACSPGFAAASLAPLQCSPCDLACTTCTGLTAHDCVSCRSGAQQTTCPCPDGYALAAGYCALCHSTCKTCTATGFGACASCFDSAVLEKAICVCSPDRLSGQKCTKCVTYCKTCGENGVCKSCYSNASASSVSCVCYVGYYPSPDPTNCVKCHATCWSCSGPLATDCTDCKAFAQLDSSHACHCTGLTAMMQTGSCFMRTFLCADPYCTQCRDAVAVNTAQTDSYGDFYGSCSCRADSQFYVIPSRLMAVSAALSPLFGFFDSFFNYYAAADLPAYFEDQMAGKCQSCSAICRGACTQDPFDCWLCAPHAVKSTGDLAWRCHCVTGFYFDADTQGCVRCMLNCASCEGATKCTTCSSGFELAAGRCHCVLPSCGCALGTFLLHSTNSCVALCPSGYTPSDGECRSSADPAFRFILSTMNSPVRDQTGRFAVGPVENSACGGFSFLQATVVRLYQRGFWLRSDQPQCIALTQDAGEEFVFAPTHYVELWVKAADVLIYRYAEDYYISTDQSRLLYASGSIIAFLNDDSNESRQTHLKATLRATTKWTLLRYELISQLQGSSVTTRLRSLQDNQLLKEAVVSEYYFRDAPIDGKRAAFKVAAWTDTGAFVHDITLGNREWQLQAPTACGCEFCSSGLCLSNCQALEFQRPDSTCSRCNSTCTEGCVRASDCDMSTDPLCEIFLNFEVCQTCKVLARLQGQTCKCTEHAVLDAGTCRCQAPYAQYQAAECRKCLNYLNSQQVTAAIAADFLSVTFAFAAAISVTADMSCPSYFNASTFAKFGDSPVCSWSGTTLRVDLGAQATLMPEELDLNPESLLKVDGPCTFRMEPLAPVAKFLGSLPVPEAVITAPLAVSLTCAQTMVVSALGTKGSRGRAMTFKWKFSHESQGAAFAEFGQFSTNFDFLSLPLAGLSPGRLSVELTVQSGFGTTSTALAEVQLVAEKALELEIECGSLTITSQTQAAVSALLRDSCGLTGQPNFSWTYVDASPPLNDTDPSPAKLLPGRKLVIQKGALAGGHTYTFLARVQLQDAVATAPFSVTVQKSPLKIRLSREGGTHPNDHNLLLDATSSFDPDNVTSSLSFLWTCQEDQSACTDSSNGILMDPLPTPTVFITTNRLRLSAIYNFTLVVSEGARIASRSVTIEIVKTAGCYVLLPPLPETIVTQSALVLASTIETSLVSRFLWTQTAGPPISPVSPTTYPFLAFSPGSLLSGETYTFTITVFTYRGTVFTQVVLAVNRAPIGGLLRLQPASGVALSDEFRVTTGGWEDPEGDYPLKYLFCVRDFCMSQKTFTPWISTRLPAGEATLTVHCIDSQGSDADVSQQVFTTASLERRLSTGALRDAFESDIADNSNACFVVLLYATAADPSLSLAMIHALENYVGALSEVDSDSLSCILTAVETLSEKAPASADSLTSLAQTVAEMCPKSQLRDSHLAQLVTICAQRTTDEEWSRTRLLLSSLLQLGWKLPDQPPFQAGSPRLSVFARRLTFVTLNLLTSLSVGNFTIAMEEQWMPEPASTGTTVVDLLLFARQTNQSWVLESELWALGNYYHYNLNLGESVRLYLQNFNSSVNVTLPRPQGELECWVAYTHQWKRNRCSLLNSSSNAVTVSTFSLTGLTVQQRLQDSAVGNFSNQTVFFSSDCNLNPAPLALSCSFCFLAVGFTAILLLNKAGKSESAPETPNSEIPAIEHPPEVPVSDVPPETPASDQRAEVNNSLLPDGEPIPAEGDSAPAISHLDIEISPPESQGEKLETESTGSVYTQIIRKHLGLSVLLKSELGCVLFSLFLVALQVETFVLGLFYNFWYDGPTEQRDARTVFREYSKSDFGYACIAVCLGTCVSTVLQLLFYRLSGQQLRLWLCLPCLLHAVLVGASVYLNVAVCWLPGGLWAESVLWAALGQLVVIESGKAVLWTLLARLDLG